MRFQLQMTFLLYNIILFIMIILYMNKAIIRSMKSKNRLSKKLREVEAYFRLLTFSNFLHFSDSVDSADNKESISLTILYVFVYLLIFFFFCKHIMLGKLNRSIVSYNVYRLEIGHRWSIKKVIF